MYYYGFQILIPNTIEILLIILISLFLHIFFYTFIIVLVFVPFRMTAGGFHMDTAEKCCIITVFMFIILGLLANFINSKILYTNLELISLILITIILGLYCFLKYAPKDTPNKPIIDLLKRKKLLNLVLFFLCVWIILVFIFYLFGYFNIVICFCLALLNSIFMISNLGHKILDRFNDWGFNKEVKQMKNMKLKVMTMALVSSAIMSLVTFVSANAASWFLVHQPKEPKCLR